MYFTLYKTVNLVFKLHNIMYLSIILYTCIHVDLVLKWSNHTALKTRKNEGVKSRLQRNTHEYFRLGWSGKNELKINNGNNRFNKRISNLPMLHWITNLIEYTVQHSIRKLLDGFLIMVRLQLHVRLEMCLDLWNIPI